MSKLIASAKRFMSDDSGATMVEYALMVALVAAVCVVAVTALGTALTGQFTSVAGSV
jgi:pilus assembly protein Flp/PilA